MNEPTDTTSFGYYDTLIRRNFVIDDCGIELSIIGSKTLDIILKANLDGPVLVDNDLFHKEVRPIVDFMHSLFSDSADRPLWYRINIRDQALNEYIGIGHLHVNGDWLEFIITYLDQDRADQSGDTIFIIFDTAFKWAVSFTLSQDDSILRIEQYNK